MLHWTTRTPKSVSKDASRLSGDGTAYAVRIKAVISSSDDRFEMASILSSAPFKPRYKPTFNKVGTLRKM